MRALVRVVAMVAVVTCAGVAQAAVDVEIHGIDGQLAGNARLFLAINKSDDRPLTAAQVRRLHRQAPGQIRKALRPLGYYRARVDGELVRRGDDWLARYNVEPGPPVRIDELDVTVRGAGAGDPRFAEAIRAGGLEKDQVLNHERYERTKRELQEAAYRGGYLDAQFTRRELRVQPEAGRAEVHLIMDSGPRYAFGEITVDQSILSQRLMQRYVGIEAGEPFDPDRLLDVQYALSDSGYFRRVEVQVQRERAAEGRVPVVIRTEPRPASRYTVGAGFGTDTGPRLSGGVQFRRLNRRGHRGSVDLRLSAIQSRLAGQYLIPVRNTTTDRYAINAVLSEEDAGDGESRKAVLGAARDRPFGPWQTSTYLNLEAEQSRFSGDTDGTLLVTPGVTVSRTHADDPLTPRRGWSLFFDAHGALEGPLSDADFLQAHLRLRRVQPLGERLRLLVRAELGGNLLDESDTLPASQRFFAGGDNSVRGYDFQDLGERNADGDVIGGRYMLAASAELDWRVWGNWGVAAFYDVGNAADEINMDLKRGVGLGLRYQTPVGPIRIDFARPLDADTPDVRLHLSIGSPL